MTWSTCILSPAVATAASRSWRAMDRGTLILVRLGCPRSDERISVSRFHRAAYGALECFHSAFPGFHPGLFS
jgi:hypothetical protein